MTDSTYNLDDNVQDEFRFILNGHEYKMRYPTTEETMKAQSMKDGDEKQLDWLYGFVSPVDNKSPNIKEALDKTNVIKLRKFTEMITKEFGQAEG